MNPDGTVAGTGLTPDELSAAGYSESEIQTMAGATDTPTSGISQNFIGPPVPAPASSGDGSTTGGSSWLGGLAAIGTTFTNVFRSLNPPAPGTRLINPATGLPYMNPATGLPYTQTQLAGHGTSDFVLVLLILLAAIFFFTRK